MRSRCPDAVIATLSLIAVSIFAGHARSEEFQCRRGDLVRRIELRFAEDADRLPCQVVYWKDQESPGEPRMPWRANSDLEFCIAKAREMVDGLQSAGWACADAAPSRDAAAPPSQDAAELDALEPSEGSSREPAAQATAPPPRRRCERDCPSRGILTPGGRGGDNALAGRRCDRDRAIRGIRPRTSRGSDSARADRRCEWRPHVRSGHSASGARSGRPPARGAGRSLVGAVQTGDDHAWRP